jgi:hypothetical protein
MPCTIFAIGINPAPVGADQAVTEIGSALRSLVKRAVASAGEDLAKGLLVSMGPKLSIILGYFEEGDLDRVLRLAGAVQLDLQSPAEMKGPRCHVAGAITQGTARRVDVFGQSWNFEGWAAIAAARILAGLQSGDLAVERETWSAVPIERHLGEPLAIPGKRGEKFLVRIHTRIHFNTAPPMKATKQARTISQDDAAARVAECNWQRLDVEASSASGFIRERHDLRAPAGIHELVIPLTLCIPRGDAGRTNRCRGPNTSGERTSGERPAPVSSRGLLSTHAAQWSCFCSDARYSRPSDSASPFRAVGRA